MPEGRKNILRIFGTDIPGELEIVDGLRRIKGVSFTSSKAILERTGIDPEKPAGELGSEEEKLIEEVLGNGELPGYVLNRRKDTETGESKMLVSTDLDMRKRQDIDRVKKLGTYRGIRHRRGLPVRGQKTKSSFRGDSSVGVSTEKIKKKKSGEGE